MINNVLDLFSRLGKKGGQKNENQQTKIGVYYVWMIFSTPRKCTATITKSTAMASGHHDRNLLMVFVCLAVYSLFPSPILTYVATYGAKNNHSHATNPLPGVITAWLHLHTPLLRDYHFQTNPESGVVHEEWKFPIEVSPKRVMGVVWGQGVGRMRMSNPL